MYSPGDRQYYLDWLRIFAVLLLIPFHSALIFSQNPGDVVYVKDVLDSAGLKIFAGFLNTWHMPLLFFVSGAATWFGLGKRSPAAYIKERAMRLLIPFIFAIIFLVPPMTFSLHRNTGEYASFPEYYRGFFRVVPSDLSGLHGSFTPAHLWFILYLFLLSAIGLPLFVWIRKTATTDAKPTEKTPRPGRGFGNITRLLERPLFMVLLFIPLCLAYLLPAPEGEKGPVWYFVWMLYGFCFAGSGTFQEKASAYRLRHLIIAVATYAATVIMVDVAGLKGRFPIVDAVIFAVSGLSRWTWVLFLAGFARVGWNRGGELHGYFSEAAYPVYILHMLMLTFAGRFIIMLQGPAILKFVLIVLLTFGGVFVIYELAVRRFPPLRFLLGMRPAKKKDPAS